MERSRSLLLGVLLVVLLSGCAAGPNPDVAPTGAGFWLGLWHGAIVPVTVVISLFTDTVNVYEVANNGNWYDFGYALGLGMVLGGGGGASGRGRR